MRNFLRISASMLLLGTLAALAWASDPWKAKPYQQWDQKDVAKILNDSPWAKTESVTADWQSTMTSNPVMTSQGSGAWPGEARWEGLLVWGCDRTSRA